MCILFLYVCADPKPGSYKIILAANRDEFYARPTSPANFWGTEPEIIGGRDMEPGREGGTWLAISQDGKIGSLLNILHDNSISSDGKKGRGSLVNNYLLTPSDNGSQYLKKLHLHSDDFMPFNLITVDVLNETGPSVTYYSNQFQSAPEVLGSDGVYSFGNSPYEKPFKKVSDGKTKFANIVNDHNHNNRERSDHLITELVNMLRCEEKHHPDPQMKIQAPGISDAYFKSISSKFVKTPGYGSRTHTIILVDEQNRVEYHEMTLQEPISFSNHKWLHSNFRFTLQK